MRALPVMIEASAELCPKFDIRFEFRFVSSEETFRSAKATRRGAVVTTQPRVAVHIGARWST